MSRHVDRELARVRVRGRLRRAAASSTELAPLVRSLIATLARTPAGEQMRFELEIRDDMRVPLDRTDLAEVLGNLLENAARYAKARVRVSAEASSSGPSIIIEDDGEVTDRERWIAHVNHSGSRSSVGRDGMWRSIGGRHPIRPRV